MIRNEIKEKIIQCINDVLIAGVPEDIEESTEIIMFANSLDKIQIIMEVEKAFNIYNISEKESDSFIIVGDLIDYVEKYAHE